MCLDDRSPLLRGRADVPADPSRRQDPLTNQRESVLLWASFGFSTLIDSGLAVSTLSADDLSDHCLINSLRFVLLSSQTRLDMASPSVIDAYTLLHKHTKTALDLSSRVFINFVKDPRRTTVLEEATVFMVSFLS